MEIKRITALLLALSAGQFLAGVVLLVCVGESRAFDQVGPVMWACVTLMLLSGVAATAGVYAAGRYQDKNFEESMRNLEQLNGRLREQKHDLMNHFQVVYGLLELGEYEEAHSYIRPVFKDIQRLNMALKTAQPAVNALLQAKMETAGEQGIDFYLEVGTDLKNIPVKPWDLCRILANLLDNAITALESCEGEKKILVRMQKTQTGYQIAVENNGPVILGEHLHDIFRSGFTTKREEGHGQGLAIVARLVREAQGEIRVKSLPEETVFTVYLPEKEASGRQHREQ